jgi:hypothetical protein
MKKIMLLAAILAAVLFGCKKESKDDDGNNNEPVTVHVVITNNMTYMGTPVSVDNYLCYDFRTHTLDTLKYFIAGLPSNMKDTTIEKDVPFKWAGHMKLKARCTSVGGWLQHEPYIFIDVIPNQTLHIVFTGELLGQ